MTQVNNKFPDLSNNELDVSEEHNLLKPEPAATIVGPALLPVSTVTFTTGQESDLAYGCSDASAEKIDVEIGDLLHKARETASEVLQSNRAKLSQLAQRLLAEESIEGQELQRMLEESCEELRNSASATGVVGVELLAA